jgi:hypothetical protein
MAVLTSHVGLEVGLVIQEFVLQTRCSPNAFIRIKTKREERQLNEQIRMKLRNDEQ